MYSWHRLATSLDKQTCPPSQLLSRARKQCPEAASVKANEQPEGAPTTSRGSWTGAALSNARPLPRLAERTLTKPALLRERTTGDVSDHSHKAPFPP